MIERKISAGSFDLNKWLFGGYEGGIITMIAGSPGSGKTNFVILAACSQAKKKKKVIFIDSEGGFSPERVRQIVGDNYQEILSEFLLLEPKSFDEQKKIFEKLLENVKKNHVSMIVVDSMAMLYRQLQQFDYAITTCLSAIRIDTASYKAYYELGTIYNKQKNYVKAAEAFQKVTELKPNHYSAFEALGVALENAGKTDEAIVAYQQTIELKPNSDDAYYRLAALFNKLARYSEALEMAKKSLEIDSRKNGKAAFEAGIACERLGRFQEAIKYYNMAGELDRRWKKNADYQIDLINRKLGGN